MQEPESQVIKPKKVKAKKSPKRVKIPTLVGIVVVVGLAAFVAGTRTPGIFAWFTSSSQNKNLPSQLDLSSVQQVYATLKDQFDGKLDVQKLVDGAKKGLVDAAGDQYTVYFTSDEAKQFSDELDGKFSGIGAELDKRNNALTIVSTIDGSPAQKTGLQAGDVIAKVNDQDTTSWSIDQAVATIRGNKGTTVKLTIVRNQDVKDYSIVRDDIVNPSVTYSETADNIGYLRISRFADDTTALAKQAAAEFKAKGVKGVILDLRGDGGGYLNAAQAVSSLWLNQGDTIVQERRGTTVTDTLKSDGNNTLNGVPTVVLIDGASASASEITAGALHDHNAAKLVGVKSFGKGSVQQLIDLDAGAQLKVTVAKWFTPNGVNITKEGIQPDVQVNISDSDIAAGKDPQKDKAIQLLSQ